MKMNNMPLVSLIIISYNQKDYIADCMQSLLQLTYPNIELFYLDDYSPDGSFHEACRYEEQIRQKYEMVSFIGNKENRGLIKNLNLLVELSKGKYVKFMAADDFLLEDSISKMVEFMETNEEHDMMYSNGFCGDRNIHFPLNEKELSKLYEGMQPSGMNLFERLYENDFIAAPTAMIKREVYERLGLYDSNLGIEDWDCYLRIAKQGSIGYMDDVTVMYRFTDDSLSHSNNPLRRINMQKSGLLIQEKYKEFAHNSKQIMNKSFNNAYQDALHIDDAEYFIFLQDYARRNNIELSVKNKCRFVLYKLHVFKVMEKFV